MMKCLRSWQQGSFFFFLIQPVLMKYFMFDTMQGSENVKTYSLVDDINTDICTVGGWVQ